MTIEIMTPKNTIRRIEQLWAVLSSDEHGEGLVSAPLANGLLTVPLVGADQKRADDFRKLARALAPLFGKQLRLVRFTVREELEVFEP